ncbi:MAG: F0F1 ATP synthase subunit epsilon [Campylobacter sp.]|nr:F0F1 ATP synthase subunit epsilon [Campylobacter sp.]
MNKFLLLEIVTPEGLVFSGEVASVQLPGQTGELGVLPGHSTLLTGLKNGNEGGIVEIVDKEGKKQLVIVNGGFLKVDEEKTTILATQAVAIGGDSENAVAKSLQRAKELLNSISTDTMATSAIMARVDEFARQK